MQEGWFLPFRHCSLCPSLLSYGGHSWALRRQLWSPQITCKFYPAGTGALISYWQDTTQSVERAEGNDSLEMRDKV